MRGVYGSGGSECEVCVGVVRVSARSVGVVGVSVRSVGVVGVSARSVCEW